MQTAWLFISLYLGKRGRENQAAMKKSILRLVTTADGAEYFELNRNEPGAVLTTKNHQVGSTLRKTTQTARCLHFYITAQSIIRVGYVDVKSEGAILEASRRQTGTWVHAIFNEEIFLLSAQISLLHCYRGTKRSNSILWATWRKRRRANCRHIGSS